MLKEPIQFLRINCKPMKNCYHHKVDLDHLISNNCDPSTPDEVETIGLEHKDLPASKDVNLDDVCDPDFS